MDSSYTAPSTQPPDTLPTTSPSGETASAAPGSRGALRKVRTTVARPNVSPASHHLVTLFRMSRTASPRRTASFRPRTFLLGEPAVPLRLFPRVRRGSQPPRLTAADAGRRGTDQIGYFGIGGGIIGPQVVGRQPAVLIGRGPLPGIQSVEGQVGGFDEDSVERLLLGDLVPSPGELDPVPRDRLAETGRVDDNAGLLAQFAGAGITQGLAGFGRTADGEPVGAFRMARIPAVQQEYPALGVDGQHPGGLPVPRGHFHSTILEMGISRMSCAPAAFRAGISVLTPRLATTVSTAFMSPRASVVIVGEDRAGSISVTAASRSAATLSFSRTLPRAWMAPRSSSAMSSMAARLSGSAKAGPDAISSV